MADIPQYQQQVNPTPMPLPFDTTRVPAEAVGGAAAQGLEQIGAATGHLAAARKREEERLAREAKKDADATATISMMAQTQELMNTSITDQTPGSDGYMSLRGDAAVKAKQYAVDTFNDKVDEIAKQAKNVDQANTFGHIALALKKEARNHVENHFKRESEIYAQTQYEGLQQELNRGVAQPAVLQDEGARDAKFNQAVGTATAEAQRRGEDPTLLAGQAAAKITKTMLDNLLAGKNPDIVRAAMVLGKYGDRLGDDKKTYVAKINDHIDIQEATAQSDKIVAAVTGPNGQVDFRRGREIIKATIPDGKLRDDVQLRFNAAGALLDKAWKDEATELSAIVQNAGFDPVSGRFNVALVPPAMMQQLEVKWRSEAERLKLHSRTADEKQDEQQYLLMTERLFGGDNWESTANMTLNEFKSIIGTLAPKSRVRLQAAFDAQQKKVNEPPDEHVVFEEAKKPLGLGGDKIKAIGQLNPEKQKVFHDVYVGVMQDVRDWRASHHGEKPPNEKLREFVVNQIQPVITIKPAPLDWFGGTVAVKRPRYEVEAGITAATMARFRQKEHELFPDKPPLSDEEMRKTIRSMRGY